MVPGHPFNEMKPKSGAAGAEPDHPPRRGFADDRWIRTTTSRRSSSRRSFAIDETRKPRPHVARLIKIIRNTCRVTANKQCQAAIFRNDREHHFVRDIVADENRTAALERFMRHQFADAGRLGEAGMFD